MLCLGCEEVVEQSCTPLDVPTFTNVYDLILQPSCAVGGSCHGNGSAVGGLDLGTLSTAHNSLLEGESVVPGEPERSPLMSRLDSSVTDPQHMPPGYLLSDAERCMIASWITQGASP